MILPLRPGEVCGGRTISRCLCVLQHGRGSKFACMTGEDAQRSPLLSRWSMVSKKPEVGSRCSAEWGHGYMFRGIYLLLKPFFDNFKGNGYIGGELSDPSDSLAGHWSPHSLVMLRGQYTAHF